MVGEVIGGKNLFYFGCFFKGVGGGGFMSESKISKDFFFCLCLDMLGKGRGGLFNCCHFILQLRFNRVNKITKFLSNVH